MIQNNKQLQARIDAMSTHTHAAIIAIRDKQDHLT